MMDNCVDESIFLIYDEYKSSLLSFEPSERANKTPADSADVHH